MASRRPQHDLPRAGFIPEQPVAGLRRLHGIGEKHDRRLEPLRAVDGHDPDLVAHALIEVAFDLRFALFEPAQETL